MPSARDQRKRDLVKVLKDLAKKYRVQLALTRDATEDEVLKAFKRVVCKAHPDKGGTKEDAQRLNAAKDAWDQAKKNAGRAEKVHSAVTKVRPRISRGLKKYTAP